MIPPLDGRGRLPLGRFPADLFEIQDQFATSRFRRCMFDELVEFVEAASGALGRLPYLWVGGSYVSSDATPGDIDVACLVEEATLREAISRGGDNERLAQALTDRELGPRFRSLDLGLLTVRPPSVGPPRNDDAKRYEALAYRGYWDALWSSGRSPSGERVHGDHGYLEVRIDGYS